MKLTPRNEKAPVAAGANSRKQKQDNPNNINANSAAAQRMRLLDLLRLGPVSTIKARRELDILMPAARVHELRHRYGHEIDLVWHDEPTDCGKIHRVGLYVLQPYDAECAMVEFEMGGV